MNVYIVKEVIDSEYGHTVVAGIFSSYEKAKNFVDENQFQWDAWFMEEDETRDGLTIKEYQMDTGKLFNNLS